MFVSSASPLDLSKIVIAIGALGTAAYGLVDVSKAFWGGVSNCGFGYIKQVISKLVPKEDGAVGLSSVLRTLKANWLNGVALGDQKSIAKSLIKLNLTPASAPSMAAVLGVDAPTLKSVAGKLATGDSLLPNETDVYGRFDLLLASLLDQGYQRADQRYRNSAKLLAVPMAVGLALLGALAVGTIPYGEAAIAGLLATPLAPVAKDVASAIQAGMNVAQALKR